MFTLPSPNFDEREGVAIDMLVLHYTGMKTARAAKERLCDPTEGKRVSAHYLVDEDGSVYAMVPEDKRAWHAGVSRWRGQDNINSRSIGIEVVNPGHEYGYRPFPPEQMKAVAELAAGIVRRHRIPAWNVVAHSDIAPTRKEDPGELFDWKLLAEKDAGLLPQISIGRNVPTDGGMFGWVKRVLGMGEQATLRLGDSGPKVLEMQTQLAKFGYGLDLCSTYGKDTEATVRAFQRHFRPERVDGVWDAQCREALNALLERTPSASISMPDGRTAARLRQGSDATSPSGPATP